MSVTKKLFFIFAGFIEVGAFHLHASADGAVNNEPLSYDLQQLHLSSENVSKGNFHDLLEKLNADLALKHPGAFIEGNTDEKNAKRQQEQYMSWAQARGAKTYCETGFNAGHSALVWLSESSTRVYEFDLGEHDYSKTAETFLQKQFPNRLTVTWGDSTKTISAFAEAHPDVKCDVIVVDGGHMNFVAKSDLMSFAKMAAPGHLLVIDDTPCESREYVHCNGPTDEWNVLEAKGCIKTQERVSMGTNGGFTYGVYMPCSLWPDLVEGHATQ